MNLTSRSMGRLALGLLVTLMLIGAGGLMVGIVGPEAVLMFVSVLMIMTVAAVLIWILYTRSKNARDDAVLRQARAQLAFEKPKHGSSLAELMSVLSDDDLYDLRQHIKQRLMDQVDAGDDDYVETFEAILADAEAKRKYR